MDRFLNEDQQEIVKPFPSKPDAGDWAARRQDPEG